jgi:hypothetical protein
LFALYATNGGGPAIGRFSAANGLTLGAWTSALTLMALAEVTSRTAVLIPRALHDRGVSIVERELSLRDEPGHEIPEHRGQQRTVT